MILQKCLALEATHEVVYHSESVGMVPWNQLTKLSLRDRRMIVGVISVILQALINLREADLFFTYTSNKLSE